MLKKIPPPIYEEETVPFASAEEAWFWFSICQKVRMDFAGKNNRNSLTARPCTPDDIYRIVMSLHRKRRIETYHLQVMGEYGYRLIPPDAYCSEESTDARLWGEAMDYLEEELLLKGIME